MLVQADWSAAAEVDIQRLSLLVAAGVDTQRLSLFAVVVGDNPGW